MSTNAFTPSLKRKDHPHPSLSLKEGEEESPKLAKKATPTGAAASEEASPTKDTDSSPRGDDTNFSISSTKSNNQVDLSGRDARVKHFNYGHLKQLPPKQVRKVIAAVKDARPPSAHEEEGTETSSNDSKLRDIAFEMSVLHQDTCLAARKVFDDYQEEREEQVLQLPDNAKIKLEEHQVLKCKSCIVGHQNDEPMGYYCHYCEKRVCTECSQMCITCNQRWFKICKEEVADDPYQEHCCSRVHFSFENYSKRYWDSDEYDSDQFD